MWAPDACTAACPWCEPAPESCTSAEPCPSWQAPHSCLLSRRGASIVSKVTDKCFVKWMVVLQRLHVIKHKWRHEWSVDGVILWSCMKESFEAVLVLCCERVPGYCTHVILSLLLLSWPSVWDLWVWGVFCQKHEPSAFGACLLLKLSWPAVPSYILALFVSCFKWNALDEYCTYGVKLGFLLALWTCHILVFMYHRVTNEFG